MMNARIVLAVLLLGVSHSHARDEIVTPENEPGVGLCAPFACSVRIQQVFDSSNFPSRIKIDALDLFNNVPNGEGFVEPAHYQFYLSTTSVSSNTIAAPVDSNLGPDNRLVADFTIADFNTNFTTSFRIPLASTFTYNPRRGNLLLEIRKDHTADFGDGPIYVDGTLHASGVQQVNDEFPRSDGQAFTTGFVGKFVGPFASAPQATFFQIPAVVSQ